MMHEALAAADLKSMAENKINKGGQVMVLSLALLAGFIPVGIILSGALHATGGVFSYPVDDAYIHLQLSRNLSTYGNWGVNPNEFSSASSSLLYTVLLALLYKLFPGQVLIPFMVNCLAAIMLLVLAQNWLRRQNLGSTAQLVILLSVIFLTPLPVIVLSGMEHTLQCLFSFLFLASFSSWIGKTGEQGSRPLPVQVLVFALLTATIRYEGLFLVAMGCLVLLFRRQMGTAFKLGIIAALPAILFGIYSLAQGSYFLPNSVLVKSEAAQFSLHGLISALGSILIDKLSFPTAGVTLLATQRLLMILLLACVVTCRYIKWHSSYGVFLLVLTGTCLLHLILADTGKFYRYEAYLVFCATLITGVLISKYGREMIRAVPALPRVALFVLAFFLCFPVALRSLAAFSKAKQACVNIHDQQYQMGQFLKKFYPGETIALNDIGAVSYYTNCRILDLWGLGSQEVARSKKGNYWTAGFLDSLSRKKNARLAIVYDSWLKEALPTRWIKVANWRIWNNVVCGDDNVSFYAIDESRAGSLKSNVKNFEKDLPPTVQVVYY